MANHRLEHLQHQHRLCRYRKHPPRSQLEVKHSIRTSPSASASGMFFDGSQLSTENAWSNVRLVAGSGSGSGWLKNFLDNYGGYFSWAVNSANGEVELMRMNDKATPYL